MPASPKLHGERAPRVYAGLSPELRRRERRNRLLDSGLAVFGTAGYAAATIPGLCAHASVTTRHFYEEFESREALLLAVYDEVIASTERAVGSALAAAPTTSAIASARASRLSCTRTSTIRVAVESRASRSSA